MTHPCRSDCPAGDCAGCAFPPAAPRARCVPRSCPQAEHCARAAQAPSAGTPDIDASRALCGGGWCPLFVDRRGAALLEAAA